MKRALVILSLVLLTCSIVVMPSTLAMAFAGSCDRFVNCSGPADCAWWGLRCAAEDPWSFMETFDW